MKVSLFEMLQDQINFFTILYIFRCTCKCYKKDFLNFLWGKKRLFKILMGEKKNKEILQEPTPLKKWTRMHSIEHATTQNTLATAYLSEHHSNCLATPVIVYIFS